MSPIFTFNIFVTSLIQPYFRTLVYFYLTYNPIFAWGNSLTSQRVMRLQKLLILHNARAITRHETLVLLFAIPKLIELVTSEITEIIAQGFCLVQNLLESHFLYAVKLAYIIEVRITIKSLRIAFFIRC